MSEKCRAWLHALVCGAVFVAGLAGLWKLSRILDFHWSSHTGIVGWVTANKYPKHQEYFYYWAGVAGVPLLVFLAGLATGFRVRRLQTCPSSPAQPRRWPRLVKVVYRLFVYGVLPVVVYLLSYRPVIDGPVDLFHTGEFLVPLNELLAGAVPYRDVYLQHGLFHNALIPLLGAKVFEPTLAAVRTMQNLVAPSFVVAVYFLGLAVFRGRWVSAIVVALIVIACGLGESVRLVFGVLSLACLAVGWRHSIWWSAVAGLLALLGFWHSVEVGLYALAAGIIFLVLARAWRTIGWYAVGAFVGFWLVGWFFLWHGALPDVVRNIYAQCAYQNETWGRAFPKLPALAVLGKWGGRDPIHWYLAPIVLCLCGGWLAWRAGVGGFWQSTSAGRLLLLTTAGALFFRTALGRSDQHHLYTGTFFAILLAVFAADHVLGAAWDRRRTQRWRATSLLVVGIVFAVAVGWYVNTVHKGPARLAREWEKLQHWPARTSATNEPIARAGIVNLKGQERQLSKVVAAIQERTRPTDRVLEFTFHPAYLFFADRRSATRYFATCYASLPAMQKEAIAELERQPTPVVISGGAGFDGLTPGARSPILAAYVAEHFQPTTNKWGGIVLLERKPPVR